MPSTSRATTPVAIDLEMIEGRYAEPGFTRTADLGPVMEVGRNVSAALGASS